MYDVILAYITSFLLTYLAIPSVISVSHKKRLMDEPGERRSHSISTPSLGGIAIFAGVIFSIILWTPFDVFGDLQYILCAFIVIFLIGAKDDIDPISPWTKMLGELFAAFILVFKANVKLTSLYGIFGVYDLPELMAIAISIFVIIVIINAFNLIDGINGLSGSISALICGTLGTWFLLIDRMELAIIAFALAGSAVAFLKYNITPARIFMGDTGSLLCGLVASILAIKFVELHRELPPESRFYFKSAPAVIMGIMILPLFDTLRVFTMRSIRGRSPLSPDRNHIHHLLIDSGLTHMQATGVLVVVNVFFIFMVVRFQAIGNLNLLILVLLVALGLTAILFLIARRKRLLNQTNG